ncbi:hypothetical protein Tco_0333747, partial [Tanacetum coccineum]
SDEELEELMKDQPLSVDASPTALSPGYIANFNPEEDEEDPEEDPADYPANEGDNFDDDNDGHLMMRRILRTILPMKETILMPMKETYIYIYV